MSEINTAITREEVLTFLENERLQREQLATNEINAILRKYNCEMNADVTFEASGRVRTQIKIVAKSVV